MITIRRAEAGDLNSIRRIETQGDASWSDDMLEKELNRNSWCLVACVKGKVAGFIIPRFDGFDLELLKISVAPEYRKKGIATALMAEMFRNGKQSRARSCHLEVSIDNSAAISVYERSGFKHNGTRKGYYRTRNGPVDALLMVKAIT